MVTPVVILNLFVIQMIALWCYYKFRELPVKQHVELLLEYAIFTVSNFVLTKIGVSLIRFFMRREVPLDSGYYTLLAVGTAILLGFLYDLDGKNLKKLSCHSKFRDFLIKREIKYSQKLFVSLLLVALIVIPYVIRGPLEIYAGNAHEFLFTLSDFLPWILAIGAAVLATASCLLALLSDSPFRLVSAVLLWFGVASWIQDLFLNKKLSEADGASMNWESLGTLPYINLMIWVVLLVCIVLFCIRSKAWFSVSKTVAALLCVIQLVAVVSLGLTNSLSMDKPGSRLSKLILSGEKQLTLGSEENIVVIMLDTLGNMMLDLAYEKYPESKAIVKDFEYFDNANCNYYRTYPSISSFLTGCPVDFDEHAGDWLRDSWNSDRACSFFGHLKDAGYSCRMFESQPNLGYVFGGVKNLEGKFDNVQEGGMEVDTALLLKSLLKLSTFRGVPYVLKPGLEVLTSDFNNIYALPETDTIAYDNVDYYQRLTSEGLSIDKQEKKVFVFQALQGAHSPQQMTPQVTHTEKISIEDTIRGLWTILEEYFDQMKALGLYDKSTIIVMADHGGEWYFPGAVFMLKRPYETHDETKINSAPVSYEEFQATILSLAGCKDESFGKSFFDWKEGDERERIIYFRLVDDNYPPVKGSNFNLYHGYKYYKDEDELLEHIKQDEPDFIIPAQEG